MRGPRGLPWLVIAGAVAAVVAAALTGLGASGPLIAAISALCAIAASAKGIVDEVQKRRLARASGAELASIIGASYAARPPRVAEVDLLRAGVAQVKVPVVRSQFAPTPYRSA
jgi:hypothetical protein